MKIAAMTVATCDYFPIRKSYLIGGNSLNFAVQATRYGTEVSFIGAVGTDDFGEKISQCCFDHSINTSHLYRLKGETAHNVLHITDKGERYSKEGDWQGGVYQEFTLNNSDIDFINTHDVAMINANDTNFQSFLYDVSSQVIKSADFLDTPDPKELEESLPFLDYVFFSAEDTPESTYLKLSQKYQTMIVQTRGAKGHNVFFQGNVYKYEQEPEQGIIDTTGCGDTFHASFLMTYLKTKDIAKSQKEASGQAFINARRYGGPAAQDIKK